METNRQETIPQGYKATALGVIPQEWEVKCIKDFGPVITGSTPPTFDSENYGGSYMFVSPADLSEDKKYITTTEKTLTDKGFSQARKIPKGSVLFTCIGSTIGKVGIASQDLATNQQINAVITDGEYLFYVLSLHSDRIRILANEQAVPIINKSDFERIKLAVPPLGEQRKIAEVLGVWDLAIAKQVQLVERLTQRKRALMQRLLTAKLRLPGFSAPWKKVHYSDILKEVRRTLTWDENELYDLISVRRRSGGVFHRESLYGYEIKTKTLRPALEGDFLISKMQIVHGASGVVPKHLSGMKISGSYIALIAKDPKKLNINYFNLWSQMPLFYHQTFVSSYGVHIEKMTFDLDAFMSLSMNLPPIEEQNRIVEVISTATDEIELAQAKLELYRRQKRGLMQQLLTGKKRIPYL